MFEKSTGMNEAVYLNAGERPRHERKFTTFSFSEAISLCVVRCKTNTRRSRPNKK